MRHTIIMKMVYLLLAYHRDVYKEHGLHFVMMDLYHIILQNWFAMIVDMKVIIVNFEY